MKILIEGEKVNLKTHPSRIIYFHYYFIVVILLILIVLLNMGYFNSILPPVIIYNNYITPGFVLIAVLSILILEIKTRNKIYYITNYRVIRVVGILRKIIDSCTYDKMVNVKLIQSFLDRLLHIGTIDITTYQRTEILLKSISNPTETERMIYTLLEKRPTPHRTEAPTVPKF